MGHFINNAQGRKIAEWMKQLQWKLFQLQWKTWGRSTCVRYFPSVRHFELTMTLVCTCCFTVLMSETGPCQFDVEYYGGSTW